MERPSRLASEAPVPESDRYTPPETLEDALLRIRDLELEKQDMKAYFVETCDGYEAELRNVRERELTKVTPLLEAASARIDVLASQRQFLGQSLIAILTYEGADINVPRDLAAVAVRDFVSKPSEAKESDEDYDRYVGGSE